MSDADSIKFYIEYIGEREREGESEHVYSKLNDDDANFINSLIRILIHGEIKFNVYSFSLRSRWRKASLKKQSLPLLPIV